MSEQPGKSDVGAIGNKFEANKLIEELKAQAAAVKDTFCEGATEEDVEDAEMTYVDPTDGTVYEWDEQKRAWFPKVDEGFIAQYQAGYGFTSEAEQWAIKAAEEAAERAKRGNTEDSKTKRKGKTEEESDSAKKRKDENDQGWFDIEDDKNTNVYVSNLPTNTTDEEFFELMSKCGIIMEDPEKKEPKIKLYRDDEGYLKGDGRCCYLKRESVQLALQLLDKSKFKNSIITVEKAVFQMKGNYNPGLKKKKKGKKKSKQSAQEKLLGWKEHPDRRPKHEQVVVLKHMFDSKEFDDNPVGIIEIRDEVRTECEKFGKVKKVMVFDRNFDGVISVAFETPEMADLCLETMNGRWFGGRQITAEIWDGKTNFHVEETDKERKERLKEWGNYLSKS